MGFTSFVLKSLSKEKLFHPMDPTNGCSFMLDEEKVNEGFEITVVLLCIPLLLALFQYHLANFQSFAFKKKSTATAFVAKKTIAYFGKSIFATPSFNDYKHRLIL
ncbi:hypothetical protein THRCLA_20982 [Thraustotheca clavata]|uniref:Uncharacterized protein n=1 Tax=Thraustotheca clavata TaxID=74557 RepID=A0A1W0A1A6_9STRA|nr:hypothetical protein THRCLA_20982 [Thraustotheca clavata]